MEHGPPDEVTRQLALLAATLTEELRGVATVDQEQVHDPTMVTITPHRPGALAVTWLDFGTELQVEAGTNGGLWELERTLDEVAGIEEVAGAAIEGRVVEVFAPKRSRVLVTLRDGTVMAETGYQALGGCLPLPGWPRWGRRVTYLPYRD